MQQGYRQAGQCIRCMEAGTVSMESEVVMIKITNHLQEVDCTFNFENKGPACSVRIGFPDFTNMPDATSQETVDHPTATFLTYKCYVDGNEVMSELVPEDDHYGGSDDVKLWHASDVEFSANSKVTVRSCYSQFPNLAPTDMEEPIRQLIKVTRYILQTAASWQGPVKRADIYVTFDKDVAQAPLELASVQELENSKSEKSWWKKASTHTVCYCASVKPSVNGQELHFTLTDFRPTEKDDLLLFYQPMKPLKAETYLRYVDSVLSHRKAETVHVSTPKDKPKGTPK